MSLLSIENVSFRSTNRSILENINYEVSANDFIILLGSNGSGKSTLIKLVHRHYQPHAGHIKLKNKPIQRYSALEFGRRISVLTQNCDESLFPSLTLYENYLLLKNKQSYRNNFYNTERQFLANYLSDFNPNLASKLDQLIHELSGGEKQALALAFCLLNPPEILLLDEHTSALDPKTSESIMNLTYQKAREHQITCLLTTHDMDLALRYGNRILMLENGKVHKMFNENEKKSLTKQELIQHY